MNENERRFVQQAAAHFAHASLFNRVANVLGQPVAALVRRALPPKAMLLISDASRNTLATALVAVLKTLPNALPAQAFEDAERSSRTSKWGHAALTTGTGALSGFFGLAALPFELPVTTGIILRSVAAIARNYGEDLTQLEARLECLNVFALSGSSEAEDAGYYGIRLVLQEHLRASTTWAASMSLSDIAAAVNRGDAPLLLRLIMKIAERFEVTVTEKALLTALPIISAGTSALLNTAFSEHVGQTASYHFGIRALERTYGAAAVHAAYLTTEARRLPEG